MTCDLCGSDLIELSHPDNSVDWDRPGSRQGYQFYQCLTCGAVYGCRHQFDASTGSDDRWHRFKAGEEIKRHY